MTIVLPNKHFENINLGNYKKKKKIPIEIKKI